LGIAPAAFGGEPAQTVNQPLIAVRRRAEKTRVLLAKSSSAGRSVASFPVRKALASGP
jgi:hypothetical protein